MAEYYFERENAFMSQNHVECFVQKIREKKESARPHIHLAVEIIHVLDGEFLFYVDNRPYRATRGETILIRSNATHRIYSLQEGPAAYYVLKLTPDFVVELAEPERRAVYLLDLALLNGESKTHWTAEESVTVAAAAKRMIAEKEKKGYGSDMAIKLCMGEILLTLLRDVNAESPPRQAANENLVRRIYDAIVYINDHYGEEITAEECSAKLFLSYSYFSRHFKRITGHTFKDYLNLTRINQAEKALISTRKPISEIAAECGFNNLSYFSAIFKKMKGVSPSALRENKKA